MKPSRAFVILSLALASLLLLSPAALAVIPGCYECLIDSLFCWPVECPAEFTPVTAAIALAGIGGIAYLLRKRLGKAPKAR